MILGIGNDIIEVSRIEAIIAKYGLRFLNRLFTKKEQEYCSRHNDASRHFAGRFAAKEAIVKALGSGLRHGISWLDMEIGNDLHGKPYVSCSSFLRERFQNPQLLLSISHCRQYATAVAIWLQNPNPH